MINFRSYKDLLKTIRDNVHIIPTDVELIIGIPRSGLLVANILALALNKPMTDVEGFMNNRIIDSGARLNISPKDIKSFKKVLIIDDSLNFGNALNKVRKKISQSSFDGKILFSCVYISPGREAMIDYYFETCPIPRVFEWNLFHHEILEASCVDIDGVLCRDPSDQENDDGNNYLKFISNVPASIVPSRIISTLVTSRLEKYRLPTEN